MNKIVQVVSQHVTPSQCYGGTSWFDEREVAPAATPRRGFLLHKRLSMIAGVAITLASATIAWADDAYIESDGTTFINSRWYMNPNGRIEVDFARTEDSKPSSWLYLFGAADRDASSTIGTRVGMFVNVNGPYFVAGDAVDKWISPYTAPDTERHIAAIDVRAMKYCYYMKGQTAVSNSLNAASTVANTATYPVALFGNMNNKGGLTVAGSSCLPARIYRARFWTGDHLDHDYTPCVKGGVPGFIDAVDGAFVTAENPAALTASPDTPSIADDGYVSTVGNYMGVGNIAFRTDAMVYRYSRVELDYALAVNDHPPSGSWMLFDGAYSGNNRTTMYLANSNPTVGWFGGGNGWKLFDDPGIPLQTTQKDVRRTAIVDNLNGYARIETAGYTNTFATYTPNADVQYKNYSLRIASWAGDNQYFAPIKVYGFRVYENDSLKYHFKPYVKDGVPGLLDVVGDKGFKATVVATNALKVVAGGNIDGTSGFSDAYVESDGTQIINTGCMAKPNSCYEIDYQFVSVVGQARVFGTVQAGTASAELYVQGTGNLAFGHGMTWGTSGSDGIAAGDVYRRKGVFDLSTKSWTLGTFGDSISDVVEGTSTAPIALFGRSTDVSTFGSFSKVRIYSFRIYEYEDGVKTIKHEFLPCKSGDAIGFVDTKTGEFKGNVMSGANALTMSGKGVDGAERWLVAPQSQTLAKDRSTTLSAKALGAISYKWKRNGVVIPGGEDGSLYVEWRRGGKTDTYAVTPVYTVFSDHVDGEPICCTVENRPLGMILMVL